MNITTEKILSLLNFNSFWLILKHSSSDLYELYDDYFIYCDILCKFLLEELYPIDKRWDIIGTGIAWTIPSLVTNKSYGVGIWEKSEFDRDKVDPLVEIILCRKRSCTLNLKIIIVPNKIVYSINIPLGKINYLRNFYIQNLLEDSSRNRLLNSHYHSFRGKILNDDIYKFKSFLKSITPYFLGENNTVICGKKRRNIKIIKYE